MDQVPVLILEDDAGRVAGFERVVQGVGAEMRVWRSAKRFVEEGGRYLEGALVISLDCDLIAGEGRRIWGMGWRRRDFWRSGAWGVW